MKKIFLLALLCLTVLTSFSQERINRNKLTFIKSSNILDSSIGWSYNEELGEWVDYTNCINNDKDYKTKYPILQNSGYMKSKSYQNFTSIQIKTIIYNNIIYYIMIVNNWDGRYKYPHIQQDWIEYKSRVAYIFSETEFKKMFNFDTKIEIQAISKIYNSDFDDTLLLANIQTALISNKNSNKRYAYLFPVRKSKTGELRFLLPMAADVINNEFDIIFTKMYFETSFENFNNLIRL